MAALTDQIARLRGEWRTANARETQLRDECQALGIAPESVPKRVVREVAAARPTWREHPATRAQLRALDDLAHKSGIEVVLDDDMTKGQAHDLISGILAGDLPNVQLTGRPTGPLLLRAATPTPDAAPDGKVAATNAAGQPTRPPTQVIDPLAEVERILFERLARPDTEATAAANPQVNRPAQFFSWADSHFKVKAQIELADLMADRDQITDDMFMVCRSILADPKRWSEIGHRAAEAYWQAHTTEPVEHPVTSEVTDAITAARYADERSAGEDHLDTAQGVLDDLDLDDLDEAADYEEYIEAAQEAIDLAATPEITQWWTRGRAAFDAEAPTALPDPDKDPEAAAALTLLRGRATRDAMKSQWYEGARQGRRDATAAQRQELLDAACRDPRVIAEVGGRREGELVVAIGSVAKDVIADLVRERSPLHQAAAQVLLTEHELPEQFYDGAYAEWDRVHGPELTWDETTAEQWSTWMTMQLRRDPMIGTWAGMPRETRLKVIETGIGTAFDVIAEERPDLVELTATIPRDRLAAELRGRIIPNLPQLVDGSDPTAAFTTGAWSEEVRLSDYKESQIRHVGMRGWHYSLDGGGTSVTCSDNARIAVGALLAARNKPIPEWIDRAFQPYAAARAAVVAKAVGHARGSEFYHAAARSEPMWKHGNGSSVADHYLIKDVRRETIERLRTELPDHVAMLESVGVDLDWMLRHDVDPQVLRDLRAAGDDLYSLRPTDLVLDTADNVYVTGSDGRRVRVRESHFWDVGIFVDETDFHPAMTFQDAIAMVRADLAQAPAQADAPLEAEAIAEVASRLPESEPTSPPAAEQSEAPPPSPRVVAPAVDTTTGAVVFEDVIAEQSAPAEAQAPVEVAADEKPWVLDDRLIVDHIAPPAPLPVTAEVEASALVSAAGLIDEMVAVDEMVVPESERGASLTHPLWRTGGLIRARKESGGYVWITPQQAAEYAGAVAAKRPDPAPQVAPAPEAEREEVTRPEAETTLDAPAAEGAAAAASLDLEAAPEPELASPPQPRPLVAAEDFQLGTEVLVPSGSKARVRANIAALRLIRELDEQERPATADEQAVLAQWSGWGAVPEVFDNRAKFLSEWSDERAALVDLLDEKGFAQARETTLNAHYTDPAIVSELWRAVRRAGLPDDALMLEPGCGAGHFVGHAPDTVNMVGVELEPISAKIAHYLYPSQQIRNHGFERNFAPANTFTGAIGNVPFGRFAPVDPIHNAAGLSIHNHFIAKSLELTEPGGYVAVVTSMFTSDAKRGDERAVIAAKGDLIGAVRLPTGAFDKQAGTSVVTDVLVFRRREDGAEPTPDTTAWAQPAVEVPATDLTTGDRATAVVNPYFKLYPERVLGRLAVGNGMYSRQSLSVQPRTAQPLAEQLRDALDPIIDQAVEQGRGITAAAPEPAAVETFTSPGLRTAADLETEDVLPGAMRYNAATSEFEQYTVGFGWKDVPCRGKDRAEQWKVMIALGETVMELSEASRSRASTLDDRDAIRTRLNNLYDGYVRKWGPLNRFKLTEPKVRTEEQIADRLDRAITAWREKIGRAEAAEDGLSAADAVPYDGPIPDDILDEMQERAAQQPIPQKSQSHLSGAIARDPRIGMVLAVEDFRSRFDGTDAVATKTAIFTDDTTPFKEPAASAGNLDEALAISFDELGYISPERMGELLGLPIHEVIEQAEGRIYPSLMDAEQWETSTVALSGHVRDKLALARVRASDNPRYAGLVTALEAAVPIDTDPADIGIRAGATWIPLDDYRDFLVQEFGLKPERLTIEHDAVTGSWKLETKERNRHHWNVGYADKYGTDRLSGVEMFELLANNKPIQVAKTKEELERNAKPKFHVKMTEAAQASAKVLEDRFDKWLWEDGDRYLRLVRTFNDRYNSFVKPVHDGQGMTFPGLNPKFSLYPYQGSAVQRFLHDETILLDHVVGSGKTLTILASCMEAKRLGQVRQPWIVVPNHLLAQWSVESRDAYPNARILVASELDGRDDRQRFVGQTAIGDWDMVIVPQSVFGKISMRREAQIEYLEGEIGELRMALDAANEQGAEFTVKQIENAIKSATTRIENIVAAKATDDGLTFEQSGCDFMFVDEAHDYKNLTRPSNSADLAVTEGAQRATDLEMKAKYLRAEARKRNELEGKPHAPAKALAFATGTPITNSLSEIWVMMKFLRPDLLIDAGLGRIDNWAGTFAKPVTVAEMNATSTRIQMKTRMAEYANVPQLIAMYDQFRDVVKAEQIPVKLPTMVGGTPQIVEFDMGQGSIDAMADLDWRMSNIKGDQMDIDNSLKISNDGRNLTMYPTLAGLGAPDPEHSRIEHAADAIWEVYAENVDLHIPADKYGPDMTGVFQLAFCDRGTPSPTAGPRSRNLYTELRDALVARGMNAAEIAFMHHHDSPKAKAKLMEACNDGRVRVLITSTKKGGTGLNAQRALKQLVNLDPAWTAADLEQRIGRIIRQGNVHEVVRVTNLVARRSFDAMMYQYVTRKSSFNSTIRNADVPATMEDLGGDLTATWAQSKAVATGDPVFVEQVEADQKVANLEAKRDATRNANAARQAAIRGLDKAIADGEKALPEARAVAEKITAWNEIEDRAQKMWTFPTATIPDSETADLGDAVRHTLIDLRKDLMSSRDERTFTVINGVPVTVAFAQSIGEFYVSIGDDVTWVDRERFGQVLERASAAQGLLTSIRNLAAKVVRQVPAIEAKIETSRGRLAEAQAEPELVFSEDEAKELAAAQAVAEELRLEVNSRENSPTALRKDRLERERRAADGQYPGWTLDLNPTKAWAVEQGMSVADLKLTVPQKMAAARQQWIDEAPEREERRRARPWVAIDDTEAKWSYGFDADRSMPGGSVQWHDRQWQWEAWDGTGAVETGAADKRSEATYAAKHAADTFADARQVPTDALYKASMERRDRIEPLPATPDQQGSQRDAVVEATEPVAEPIVEPTGRVAEGSDAEPFTLDDNLIRGLNAASNVRPLHEVGTGSGVDASEAEQAEQGYETGQQYEPDQDDGRAV